VPGEDAIRLDGLVTGRPSDRLVQVTLANGHVVLAHAARRDHQRLVGLVAGQRVLLAMTPFDMSVGRVVFEKNRDLE
jgi:translation initiation factor IF-1